MHIIKTKFVILLSKITMKWNNHNNEPIQTTVSATLISTAIADRQTPIYQSPQKPPSCECRQDFCRRFGNEREMEEEKKRATFSTHFVV